MYSTGLLTSVTSAPMPAAALPYKGIWSALASRGGGPRLGNLLRQAGARLALSARVDAQGCRLHIDSFRKLWDFNSGPRSQFRYAIAGHLSHPLFFQKTYCQIN